MTTSDPKEAAKVRTPRRGTDPLLPCSGYCHCNAVNDTVTLLQEVWTKQSTDRRIVEVLQLSLH